MATLNQALEKAGRVADFMEFGELMCRDALARDESCGGHFREEHQDRRRRGQAQRRQVLPTPRLWEWTAATDKEPEPATSGGARVYENVKFATRSYK